VEVTIGIQSIPRELVLETNASADEVERLLSQALADDQHGLFVVADDKGGKFLVPADKIAYVQFAGTEQRRVGFGSL
jgi:hypothetical protein